MPLCWQEHNKLYLLMVKESKLYIFAVVLWLAHLTADGCVYRDSRCDMQPWARAAHLLQCLGLLSLASLRDR